MLTDPVDTNSIINVFSLVRGFSYVSSIDTRWWERMVCYGLRQDKSLQDERNSTRLRLTSPSGERYAY